MSLDPTQLFVVNAISRGGFADDLNELFTNTAPEPEFAQDDDRLTDAICQKYADALGDMDEDNPSYDEKHAELLVALLLDIGIDIT